MTPSNSTFNSLKLPWGTLEISCTGSGRPLLLIHGFPMDHRMWQGQLGAFPGWQTVRPDLRGLGKSRAPSGAIQIADHADDLAAVLDRLDARTGVVVGLSMGGYVAFEMWRRHRHRIAALGLVATRAESDNEVAARGRLEAKRRVLEVGTTLMAEQMPEKLLSPVSSPQVKERLRKMIAEAPPDGVISALDGLRSRADSTDLLSSIDVPTFVVAGKDDQVVSPQEMRQMADMIPSSTFHEVQNAGHVPPMERPDAFNRILGQFLKGI